MKTTPLRISTKRSEYIDADNRQRSRSGVETIEIPTPLYPPARSEIMPQMLLTAANRRSLPALYSNEDNDDPIVHVRYIFGSRGAFAATEFCPETETFFGWMTSNINPDYDEWCYMTLAQMEEMRPARGFRIGQIERITHFSPRPISEVRGF